MTVRKSFSEVLRKKRLALNLSQEKLADKSGLSMRSISLLENNKRQPSISTIYALSTALEISMSAFLKDVEHHLAEELTIYNLEKDKK